MTPSVAVARAPRAFTFLAGLAALLAVLELGRLVIFAAYPVPPRRGASLRGARS